jgi:uncharacterized protein
VKVLDIDIPRKRVSLTLRLDDDTAKQSDEPRQPGGGRDRGAGRREGGRAPQQRQGGGRRQPASSPAPANSAMADALRRAGLTEPDRGNGKRR